MLDCNKAVFVILIFRCFPLISFLIVSLHLHYPVFVVSDPYMVFICLYTFTISVLVQSPKKMPQMMCLANHRNLFLTVMESRPLRSVLTLCSNSSEGIFWAADCHLLASLCCRKRMRELCVAFSNRALISFLRSPSS